jgi:hypothetical protein
MPSIFPRSWNGFVDFVVTSDRRLREVAIAEHLSVLNPEEP